mgnify:FL=1
MKDWRAAIRTWKHKNNPVVDNSMNDSMPSKEQEYKAVSPLQKCMVGWKLVIGVPKHDREWDDLNWDRTKEPIRDLISFFRGDLKQTIDCMQDVVEYLKSKGLSYSITTIKKFAYQWRENGGRLDAEIKY